MRRRHRRALEGERLEVEFLDLVCWRRVTGRAGLVLGGTRQVVGATSMPHRSPLC